MTAQDSYPTWRVEAGRLAHWLTPGQASYPTAREIWAAVFAPDSGSRPNWELSPSDGLPELTFSRVPAEPALLVSGNIIEGLQTELMLTAEGVAAPLDWKKGSPPPDQIVVRSCWYPIDSDGLRVAVKAMNESGIDPGQPISLGQLIRLRSSPALPFGLLDQAGDSAAAAAHAAAESDAPVQGIDAKLYPYQRDGVSFLVRVSRQNLGCILGDEMGLGKTLQVISLVQAEKNAGRGPALVICPATLLENWRRELAQFAPTLVVMVHAGPQRVGDPRKLATADVVVTSYDTVIRDEPLLSNVVWNLLALDEAQNIKNPNAQRTACVKRLPRRVSIAVTGTPVENRLTDLWSLADFALPGLLGNLSDFTTEYDDSHSDASRLAPVVAPILLRRRVAEVAGDLPSRIDIPQVVAMTRHMAEQYEGVRREAEAEYGRAAGLVSLQRLRMYCTHPILLDLWQGDPAASMPKYCRLLEILEEAFAGGEKALIFSSYTEMADVLMKDLPRRFPGGHFNWIDGRVPVPNRQNVVDAFSAFSGAGALVLNPKAAGVGLNITTANHVVHYNPEWNPAVEDQASARAYRRKQTRPVTVHHLYFADSVEEVMVGRLNFKRILADGAASGHKGDATPDDIVRALQVSPISRLDMLE